MNVKSIGDILGPVDFEARIADTAGMKFGRDYRYKCWQCRDSGWCSVFLAATVKTAVVSPDLVDWWRSGCVRCNCARGQAIESPYRKKDLPTLGDQPWHILTHDADAKAKAAAYVHKPANYNDAFTEFAP